MYIYRKTITSNSKKIKLCGLTIYKSKKEKDKYTRTILYGLIKIKGNSYMVKYYLLGFCCAEKEINRYTEKFYFRTPSIFKKNNIKKDLKSILKEVPRECDSVYYISVPTGEAYVLARLMSKIIEKNKSKNPYFLFRNCQIVNIFTIFFSNNMNMKMYSLAHDGDFRRLCKYSYSYKRKKIYIYFPVWHYYQQDCKILEDKTNKTHFYSYICKQLGIQNNVDMPCLDGLIGAEEKLLEKNKTLKIDLNNFVIFAPEARTSLLYPLEFYITLQEKLKAKGIDVFWNIAKDIGKPVKRAILSYDEILLLGLKSKGIIGVRSGFFDIMSALSDTPKFVLYTDFPFREKKGGQHYTAEKAIAGFTLKKLPNTSCEKIYEYNTNKLSAHDISNDIIKKLQEN